MNDHEMTPEERLSALDPAAGAAYAHADVTSMLARVTATERIAKVSFAQGFRLRMGTAAAAAAMVTVGGIAALQGAVPSLSVLALGSHSSHAPGVASMAPSTTDPTSGMMMRIWETYQFVVGPNLSSGTSSAPAYVVSLPSDLNATTQQIAGVFGLSGAATPAPAPNSSWSISSDTANLNASSYGGAMYWDYSSNTGGFSTGTSGSGVSSPPVTTVPPTPSTPAAPADTATYSNDQACTNAQNLLSQIGISGDLGTPQFSSSNDPTTGYSEVAVNVAWTPLGVDAGFNFSFTFDGHGTLLYANGVAATVTQGSNYPLVSEVAGVALLQSQQDSYRNSGGPVLYNPTNITTTTIVSGTPVVVPDSVPGSASGSSGSSPSGPPTTLPDTSGTPTTVPTPPVRTVTLDSVTVQYAQYTLSDGTSVLLPQYQYTGDDGSTWTVLAVDPAYVSLATPSGISPMLY